MSIICYTGLPGDGKSYSAVANVIIPALTEGRHVAHNLMLNVAALNVVCGRDVAPLLHQLDRDDTPLQIIEKCPPGAVIVIDEVWRYWPAGLKANEVPKEELKFFKEHRHRAGEDGISTEILIIDQDPQTGVPAFLRALIEITYVHTKHTKVGAKGRFKVDVYTRCQSAQKPTKGALLRTLQGRYVSEVWNCYISHTQSKNLGEAALEKQVDGRANLLKGWTVKMAIIGIVVFPFIAYAAYNAAMGMADMTKKSPTAPKVSAGHARPKGPETPLPKSKTPQTSIAPATPSPTPEPSRVPENALAVSQPITPQPPGMPPLSGTWRVLGVVTRDDGTGKVLLSSAGGRRMLDAADCQQDDADNWRCDVEDGQATMWSGARSANPMSAQTAEGVGKGAPPLAGAPGSQGV